tara:strand:+ start:2359 stop:2487 length:129 start_codon:yes stop_codon:yes gene_type:complete
MVGINVINTNVAASNKRAVLLRIQIKPYEYEEEVFPTNFKEE